MKLAGAFGLRAMTRFVTNLFGMNPKVSMSIMYAKAAWAKVIKR
jgi:hypothetical protein